MSGVSVSVGFSLLSCGSDSDFERYVLIVATSVSIPFCCTSVCAFFALDKRMQRAAAHLCVYMYMFVCVCICVWIKECEGYCTPVCVCICVYVCVCKYMCVNVFVCG